MIWERTSEESAGRCEAFLDLGFGFMCDESLLSRSVATWEEPSPFFEVSSSVISLLFSFRCMYLNVW